MTQLKPFSALFLSLAQFFGVRFSSTFSAILGTMFNATFIQRWMRWNTAMVLILFALVIYPLPGEANSSVSPNIDEIDGARLFTTHCAGCHPGGGNIIRRGKTLKQRDLKRRGLDSVEAIASMVTHGKGLMSAYSETLTAAEIATVSDYVWQQAQQNWKQR